MQPTCRMVLVELAGILAACIFSLSAARAADGPQLDVVPGPIVEPAGRPEVASWPVLRYKKPVRILVVLDKRSSAGPFLRIARRLRAVLEIRYLTRGSNAIYHVNDKWIEPKENPTREELAAYSQQVVLDTFRVEEGRCPYDVIFLTTGIDNKRLPSAVLSCVEAGALLVVTGNHWPPADSPLSQFWPAKATGRNTWHSGGASRNDAAALAGVPLQRLKGHRWMPLAEPSEGAVSLAEGETGAAFVRDVGKGKLLFVPSGPISRFYSAIETLQRQYDHDEIWLRFWDHVVYELTRSADAFPVYTDLSAPAAVSAGHEGVVEAKLVNRSFAGPLAVGIHVTNPTGRVVFRKEESITVPVGVAHSFQVQVPAALDWGSGLYPVSLTVGDPKTQRRMHQSLQFLPVRGRLALKVTTDKRGYRLGEAARILVTVSSDESWSGELALGVYDFRGRVLHAVSREVAVSDEPLTLEFTWRLVDHGVRVDTFPTHVVARKDGREWARAETRFYKYEAWSTRNEYQWSTWARVACGPPSTVPVGMRLMAHAGMNALGYPGRPEIHYPAERWGWRYYNENIGTNTFSPVIEYENDAEIEAALLKQVESRKDRRDLFSAAFVLGSVGEEAGFKRGWGTRYYWDTPVAPEKACKAFRWFLKEKYPSVDQLNRVWGTQYRSWVEIKLTREFSPGRGGRLVKLDADGWAHPTESPLGEGVSRVTPAPMADTGEFYNWYYDRIIAAAKRILRERVNPVTRIIASAPTIGTSRLYDVRPAGPSAWNDSQWHALIDGPEPGFGLIWGHFDWSVKTDNMFWGWLLTRSGHNNYWVDVPLMFNNDLTHTRASFAMRRWTHRLAGHERIILDSRPAPCDVGLLEPNGLYQETTPNYMSKSLQVALSQGGFGLPGKGAEDLNRYRIVYAVAHQAVSDHEARRLEAYVAGGGTLVFTPRFATQTEHGVPYSVLPGCGLAEKWQLRVTGRTDPIPRYHNHKMLSFRWSPPGSAHQDETTLQTVSTFAVFREQVQHEGWTPSAAYEDGTPAILTRRLGKGRLVYLNAVYNSHRYIQWVTPTGPARQGFYKLVEWLCEQAGARRTLRIDGRPAETLHMAVKQFTDPTGYIRYVILRTGGEVPWASGTLRWLGDQTAGYDILGGEIGKPAPLVGTELPVTLKPGAGKLLGFTNRPLKQLRLEVSPAKIVAGGPLRVTPHVLGDDGKPVPGSFPFELRVSAAGADVPGMTRSFSAESGQTITVHTALSDPMGVWTVTITDGISGLSASGRMEVEAPASVDAAPGFVAPAWPSEVEEPVVLDPQQFVTRLMALSKLYREDHSQDGWLTKQRLGYFYELLPETRHAILRPLLEVDWREYTQAIRARVESGAVLVLTGEDMGLHPGSGLATYPHREAHQFEAIATTLKDARWSLATRDGDTIAASLEGVLVLILCRESIDAAGHDNPSLARWQQRWLAELTMAEGNQKGIPAPSATKLRRWWMGAEPITKGQRVVTWLDGNIRQVELSVSSNESVGKTFAFVIPPTGTVMQTTLRADVAGQGTVTFDVGCDGSLDGKLSAGDSHVALKLTDAVARVADTGPYRDDNGWRIVPVRVQSDGEVHLTIRDPKVVIHSNQLQR